MRANSLNPLEHTPMKAPAPTYSMAAEITAAVNKLMSSKLPDADVRRQLKAAIDWMEEARYQLSDPDEEDEG